MTLSTDPAAIEAALRSTLITLRAAYGEQTIETMTGQTLGGLRQVATCLARTPDERARCGGNRPLDMRVAAVLDALMIAAGHVPLLLPAAKRLREQTVAEVAGSGPANLSLDARLRRLAMATGDVHRAVDDAMADAVMDRAERERIIAMAMATAAECEGLVQMLRRPQGMAVVS
ncbi:hypothetical protein P7L78_22105 [Tistrella bauzanensis]|uniref:hypothetical protein n=1 Tax=Tistrella TaxID=171436 RepID=UPI0031F6DEFE